MSLTRILLFFALAFAVTADEGMWLFDQFPAAQVARKYGVKITPAMLDKMRLASVRMNSGGSGSIVSPSGLVFTNHHVAADCIQKVSSAQNDYMANGFVAKSQGEEKSCPDEEVNILVRIEDVTAAIQNAVPAGTPTAQVSKLEKAEMTRLEKQCGERNGNRCDVVTLYSGGRHALYEYKKYTDVRLVFAPEYGIAGFGGDPDNFTYPRYCLDMAFFRIYENGKPAVTPNYLKWSKTGARDKELTFVPGHPGSTGRLDTMAQLEYQRDVSLPRALASLDRMIQALKEFEKVDAEAKSLAGEQLQVYQNSFKALSGFLVGLKDPKLMQRKADDERRLRAAIADDPAKKAKYGEIWDKIAEAVALQREIGPLTAAYDGAPSNSDLFIHARRAIRYAEEKTKPDSERLRPYVTPALPAMEQQMYSKAPIDERLEKVKLAVAFEDMLAVRPDDPAVKEALGGRSPKEAAAYYVDGTKLKDIEFRRKIAGDLNEARTNADPMLKLARLLDEPSRAVRKRNEQSVEPVLTANAGRIAQARLAVYGANDYPDATFTLRLTYGDVRGYKLPDGKWIPWATDFAGLYARATGKEPYVLPKSWIQARNKLKLNTPFNFVSTTDTHGGNSGSPTVNVKGEVNGILFDGNIEGLPNRYVFTDETARSVHVASQGIVEALRKVYGATAVLRELGF